MKFHKNSHIYVVHFILYHKNSEKEKIAGILTMGNFKKAFENQSHILGVQSFIKNGVRHSLIPLLINFFTERKLVVKWEGNYSSPRTITGGSP